MVIFTLDLCNKIFVCVSYTYRMSKPNTQTAIKILGKLKGSGDPSLLAYWVTPNTILTLSGARAYCDGVFYHKDKKVLEAWTKEMAGSIKTLKLVTDIYFAESKVDKTTSKETYAGYDVLITSGLTHVFEQTTLLGPNSKDLLAQNLPGVQLVNALVDLLQENKRLKHFNKEGLNHIAFGILVGYPDEAILGAVTKWEEDDPFAEPLIDADIRGSGYYNCPRPVYSYPRHLVTNLTINTHEKLWSSILEEFYNSEFHASIAKDRGFQQKIKELGMNR